MTDVLVDLPQKHRDPQPFARGLTRQELALSFRQMSPLTVVLGMRVREKTRAKEDRVLAIFLAQRVELSRRVTPLDWSPKPCLPVSRHTAPQ